tara:strand:- start:534 stop:1241 length:708 start_codon:yes stop_codon:yes gene_type:complete
MISFVVPTYNNTEELATTLKSIGACKSNGFEIIIVNGGKPVKVDENVTLIQENDHGVYDAMNKGLARCSNEYVIFLNSGDQLLPNNLPNFSQKKDLYVFDSLEVDLRGNQLYKRSKKINSLPYGMITHHQALIFKKEIILVNKLKYDLTYKIASDYKFFLDFADCASSIEEVNSPLCIFHKGGLSHSKRHEGLFEQFQIRSKKYNLFFAVYIMFIQFLKILIRYNAEWLYSAIKR